MLIGVPSTTSWEEHSIRNCFADVRRLLVLATPDLDAHRQMPFREWLKLQRTQS